MNPASACCADTIPLYRPWWQRAWNAVKTAFAPRPADPYRELRGLSPQTLRDIGAPPEFHESRGASERWRLDVRNW